MHRSSHLVCVLLCALARSHFPRLAAASDYHGQVTFHGFPVPGATVTLTQGTKKLTTVTDQGGLYTFADLADGPAKIEIEMQCFSTVQADVSIAPNMPAAKWELTLASARPDHGADQAAPNPPPTHTAPAAKKSAAAEASNSNLPEIPKPQDEKNSPRTDSWSMAASTTRRPRSSRSTRHSATEGPTARVFTMAAWPLFSTTPRLRRAPILAQRNPATEAFLQSHHWRLHVWRAAEDSAFAAAWAHFLRGLPVDARPNRRNRIRSRTHGG